MDYIQERIVLRWKPGADEVLRRQCITANKELAESEKPVWERKVSCNVCYVIMLPVTDKGSRWQAGQGEEVEVAREVGKLEFKTQEGREEVSKI